MRNHHCITLGIRKNLILQNNWKGTLSPNSGILSWTIVLEYRSTSSLWTRYQEAFVATITVTATDASTSRLGTNTGSLTLASTVASIHSHPCYLASQLHTSWEMAGTSLLPSGFHWHFVSHTQNPRLKRVWKM